MRHSVDAAYCYGRSSVVCLLVGLSVMTMSPAKTAEPIEIQFEMLSRMGPGNHVLDWSAHCRHLANMIEPSMCSGVAALCQISLTTC